MTSFFPPNVPPNANLPQYATVGDLPVSATTGDLAIVLDTNSIYLYKSIAWIEIASQESVEADLQHIYDQSSVPQLITSLVSGALTIRKGALASPGDLITLQDDTGTRVAGISDTGALKIGTGLGVLHSDASGNVTSGLIVNEDISDTAAIALSKLATGALPTGITVASANIVNETIVNEDISPTAAIAGTKINPDFGSQNITTTAALDAFAINVQNVNAVDVFGSIDATTVSGTLGVGTGFAGSVNIGTGPLNTNVNIGGSGSIVAIDGTLTIVDTANLDVTDKLITINKGGLAASGGNAGIEIEEGGSATGYVKSNSARTAIDLKAPSTAVVSIQGSSADTIIAATSTATRTLTLPNVSGTIVTTGDTGSVSTSMLADGSVTDAKIIDGSISRNKLATGSANHVLINDGSGIMSSESSLAATRGGTGQTSIATGDLLYGSGTNTISKLPIGSSSQVLTVLGGVPTWQAGLTDPMTTAGDIIIRNGSNATARLPVGAANTVLTSNGTVPTYTQVTSAMIANETISNVDISPSANIDGSKIQAASGSNAGVVTTGAQTLAGIKTLTGNLVLANSVTTPGTNQMAIGTPGASANTLRIAGQNGFAADFSTGSLTTGRTYTLPDIANSTFVVTQGAQTVAGNKTFSGVLAATEGSDSTSPTTGALRVTGGVGVRKSIVSVGQLLTTAGIVEVGTGRGSNGIAYIDITTQAGANYNARLLRDTGANGALELLQEGSGELKFTQGGTGNIITNTVGGSAYTALRRSGTDHIFIDGTGTAVRGRTAAASTGFVGETQSAVNNGTDSIVSSSYSTAVTLSGLSAGIWQVRGQAFLNNGSSEYRPAMFLSVNGATSEHLGGFVQTRVAAGNSVSLQTGSLTVVVTSTSTITLQVRSQINDCVLVRSLTDYNRIEAVRIA